MLRDEHDSKFHFKGSILSRLPDKYCWIVTRVGIKKIKHQEPAFQSRLFDESKYSPFEVTAGREKISVIRKAVPIFPSFYAIK